MDSTHTTVICDYGGFDRPAFKDRKTSLGVFIDEDLDDITIAIVIRLVRGSVRLADLILLAASLRVLGVRLFMGLRSVVYMAALPSLLIFLLLAAHRGYLLRLGLRMDEEIPRWK